MKEVLEEYGSLIFTLLLGLGFFIGLVVIFNAVTGGWIY